MDTNSEINGRYFMDKAILNSENENIEYIKCQLNINNHKNNNTKSLEKKNCLRGRKFRNKFRFN